MTEISNIPKTNNVDPLKINYSDILKVGIPISLGVFVQFIVALIDNFFVAQINGNAMSAVSFVGLIYITLAMLGVGLSNASQILIARRKGEGKNEEVASTLSNAFWMALIISCIQFAVIYFLIPPLLDRFIQSDEVRTYMKDFIGYRSLGFFFYTLSLMLNSFWSGIAQTKVLIFSTLITATFTIILDYLLVFGHFGMPQMGVSGAALATICAEAAAFIFILFYTINNREAKKYFVGQKLFSFPIKYSKSLIHLGGPISMQLILSLGIWAIFYKFVEHIGERELQSSFIVRNMYMLAYVSVGGFSTAAKTYVSGLIAEGRQSDLIRTSIKIMLMNLLGIAVLSHGLWLYPEKIAGLFTQDQETIAQTIKIMLVVLPAMMVFAFTSIMLAMVEGSGNTMAGFIVEILTTVVYIGSAYLMVYHWNWPIHWVWTADYVYFVFIGILSLAFLWNGKWKWNKV